MKDILLIALKGNRLPHAYLFFGNDGVGKDAMALELARVLQCEKQSNPACGVCSSCTKLKTLQHPDVRFITALPVGKGEKSDDSPLAKLAEDEVRVIQEQLKLKGSNPYYRVMIPRANIIKINSIREVRRESAMTTFGHRKRVFIISHADEMGEEASNTILKTLEEPPGDTLLILTTSRPENLLPTIRSRCQNVRFDPLTEEDIQNALVEREKIVESQALSIARLANGSYVRALELLQEDVAQLRQDVVAFVKRILGTDTVALSHDIEALSASRDREKVVHFLTLMLMWFRDAFVLTQGGEIINLDQQEDLKRFTAKFPSADLVGAIAEVERAISLVYKNGYINLVLLLLATRVRKSIQPENSGKAIRVQV
ncbi:MAG: DNA polymerase III subunit delta' [Ignavibacteriae bacterium]|nr:DNA polymerase III subunit delta' [Ignavibacteriota bacterium]